MFEDYQIDISQHFENIDVNENPLINVDQLPLSIVKFADYDHETNNIDKVIGLNIGEYICYVTKNKHGGWLEYIDVTEYPELHIFDFSIIDDILPFHGGCTFSQWVSHIGKKKFDTEHYLIGCDWCHNTDWNNWKTITTFNRENLFGVENVSFDNVLQNLRKVIEKIPEFRLKMTIRGNNV